uniref:Uncharacterized protein n=1 Tax=Rhizophora mucronata TaxID=61149 RepID=A0A2P2KPA8_RHIMU
MRMTLFETWMICTAFDVYLKCLMFSKAIV